MKDKYKSKSFSQPRSPKFDSPSKRKQPPPVETLAETYYYKKQMDARTEIVFVLQDDEEIEGTIEWYDKGALKINRQDAPNILLLKHNIKFLFKAEERE
jgi:hypothetical protein